MLILKKFHDYYDSAIGFGGIDKTLVYDRKTEEIKLSSPLILEELPWADIYPKDNVYTLRKIQINVIGFCGKTYVICSYQKEIGGKIEIYIGDEVNNKIDTKKSWRNNDIKSFLEKYHNKENLHDVFTETNCPVFLIEDARQRVDEIIINPKLKDWNFFRLFDSFTTFQEISMYLGGVLGSNEKDISEVDEKYRQSQRGMDKWSFRNPDPPKRKQK